MSSLPLSLRTIETNIFSYVLRGGIFRCYVAPSSWIFRFVWIIAARLVDERQRKRVLLLVGNWCVIYNLVSRRRFLQR